MGSASGQGCDKRSERAQAQRERILAAAQHCFVVHGFHAASMAGIAEEAQMSPGLIYRYFDSKNAIILAIIQRKRADIAALQSESDLAPRILELFRHWQQGDPEVMSAPLFLEMTTEASRDPSIAEAVRSADELSRADFVSWLQQRKQSGGCPLSQDEAQWRALALQCFIEGLAIRAIREPQLEAEILELSLQGVLGILAKE